MDALESTGHGPLMCPFHQMMLLFRIPFHSWGSIWFKFACKWAFAACEPYVRLHTITETCVITAIVCVHTHNVYCIWLYNSQRSWNGTLTDQHNVMIMFMTLLETLTMECSTKVAEVVMIGTCYVLCVHIFFSEVMRLFFFASVESEIECVLQQTIQASRLNEYNRENSA